jgi:D-aminoacyl-tRNA deacylase
MQKATENQNLDYEVSYEGTHHGPSLDVPTMFAELGSSPPQWNDTNAAKAVAAAVTETILKLNDKPVETVLGIGGPHYNAKFTRMALESETAFGHMIPKYAVSSLDTAILNQCIQRTIEKVTRIILDWKGIQGQDKQSLIQTLEKLGIPFEKV